MSDAYDIYFFRRAEIELERARQSAQPEARHAHHEMASLYLERFYAARATEPQATGRRARSAWASVPSSR